MLRRFIFLMALVLPMHAMALSLDEAKAQGLVGERVDGYLGPINESAEVVDLVKTINNQRRAEYQRIAASNGQSLDVVQKLAAQKAYDLTPSGYYLQSSQGGWAKK